MTICAKGWQYLESCWPARGGVGLEHTAAECEAEVMIVLSQQPQRRDAAGAAEGRECVSQPIGAAYLIGFEGAATACEIENTEDARRIGRAGSGNGKAASGISEQHDPIRINPSFAAQGSDRTADIFGRDQSDSLIVGVFAGVGDEFGIGAVGAAEASTHNRNRGIAVLRKGQSRA